MNIFLRPLPRRLLLGTFLLTATTRAGAEEPPKGTHPGTHTDVRKTNGDSAPVLAQYVTIEEIHNDIVGLKGRVVLLHLWASWCAPCLEELPMMARFAREMKPRGLEVISISLDEPSDSARERVGALITDKTRNVLRKAIVKVDDPDAFLHAVDPKWEGDIPALFAYDREGHLRRAMVGEASRKDLDKMVADLLKKGS